MAEIHSRGFHHAGFFCQTAPISVGRKGFDTFARKKSGMSNSQSTMAKEIAQAAVEYERKATGHSPKSVTVVLGEDTLVVTLHGALTPAEMAMAQSPEGAARMQEFHRRLFDTSSKPLWQQIERITGVDVREAAAEVEPETGGIVKTFATGTVIQVFILASALTPAACTINEPEYG
jgi:uncharacterized protein YbcI